MIRPRILALAMAAALTAPAAARACGPEIDIRFFEASDGDVFIIANKSRETWLLVTLEIDLVGSKGRLVFDTEDGGAGFSMHAPFAAASGDVGLVAAPDVADGAERVGLSFTQFAPGRDFTFVIDLDDRLESSDFGQAVVSGPEIDGAKARAQLITPDGAQTPARGRFGPDGRAVLRGGLCA
ncbi:MAG: hypothetical protein OXR84_11185 [Magnetovibrio sp.]|nr:hypothetical protein [Magnetovibrio sp.]